MEPIVVWLLIFVVFFCVLYFTVKAAVRDGILAARQARRNRPSKTRPTRKRMAKCHPFFFYPRGPAPFKTPEEQGR